jgi:hypothetical protein
MVEPGRRAAERARERCGGRFRSRCVLARYRCRPATSAFLPAAAGAEVAQVGTEGSLRSHARTAIRGGGRPACHLAVPTEVLR